MDVTFVFWNIRKAVGRELYASVGRLARTGVDVFLFAECPDDPAPLLAALNGDAAGPYSPVPARSRKVLFFSRLAGATWTDRFNDPIGNRMSVQGVQVGTSPEVLLVGSHLTSAANADVRGRSELARNAAEDVRTVEADAGHARTVVVGDLNLNPFDDGLIAPSAFHAVMSRELVGSAVFLKSRRTKKVFYNPMWSCLGDRPDRDGSGGRPPGTYFYNNTTDPAHHFWQMFDQVLVRPELVPQLRSVEIVTTDGERTLMTPSGRPRASSISDHYPIRFVLDL